MTSRSRRKHQITVRNLLARTPIEQCSWRDYFSRFSKLSFAGLLAAAAVSPIPATFADELGRPPARFQISDDARPIEEAEAEVAEAREPAPVESSARWNGEAKAIQSANEWKLRWRSPGVMPASTTGLKPLAVARAAWNAPSPKTYAVRQAAQNVPVDPFEEPYPGGTVKTSQIGGSTGQAGSGQAGSGQRSGSTQPGTSGLQSNPASPSAPGSQLAPQPLDPGLSRPNANQTLPESLRSVPESPTQPDPFGPTPETPAPMTDEAPRPPAGFEPTPPADRTPDMDRPTEPQSDSATDPLLAPVPQEKPCDRTYNNRNCCTDEDKCKQARSRFSQYKITSISLDITPSFTNTESPTSATYVPTEVRKDEELAKAPSRTWRNRAGEVVADGRFEDYRTGHVIVRGEDGQAKEILFNELSDDDICFVTAWWSLPGECSLEDQPAPTRDWIASTLTWKASALCHKPLYFEEVALERYGHSVGPIKQPFVSGAHFFGSLITLPYQMGVHPVNECQYALGYYRPGSCAPWLVPPFPVSTRGALAQAGVIVGGIYIIP